MIKHVSLQECGSPLPDADPKEESVLEEVSQTHSDSCPADLEQDHVEQTKTSDQEQSEQALTEDDLVVEASLTNEAKENEQEEMANKFLLFKKKNPTHVGIRTLMPEKHKGLSVRNNLKRSLLKIRLRQILLFGKREWRLGTALRNGTVCRTWFSSSSRRSSKRFSR